MSIEKEPHIYSFDDRYEKRFSPEYENSFLNIFDWDKSYKYHGESSTSYWVTDNAPERIFKDNPECKLVVLLRDPIDRIISHYTWLFSLGRIKKNFREEVSYWINQKYSIYNNPGGNYKYYDLYSRYGTLIERYLEHFNKDQVLIIEFEQMKNNTLEIVNQIYKFLGLKVVSKIEETIVNKSKKGIEILPLESKLQWLKKIMPNKILSILKIRSKYKKVFNPITINAPKPTEEDIIWLKDLFKEEVIKLNKLTGFIPKSWPNFKFENV